MRLINSDSEAVEINASGGGSANANSLRVELGGVALVGSLAVMLVTVGFAVWALLDSKATRDLVELREQSWSMAFAELNHRQHDTDTSAKILERRYMDFTAYAMLNGWDVRSTDKSFGPTGNLERMIPQEKQHGRR